MMGGVGVSVLEVGVRREAPKASLQRGGRGERKGPPSLDSPPLCTHSFILPTVHPFIHSLIQLPTAYSACG